MKAHVVQRNTLSEGEGAHSDVTAVTMATNPCTGSSQPDAFTEEKHCPEGLSSPNDAHHQEENLSREFFPPLEKRYPCSLSEILIPDQTVEFQDPHAPLFEYLPTDQFSIEETLDSLVRSVSVTF